MSDVLWSPRAKRDLDEIWDYIAAFNPDAADRLVERIDKRLEACARQPTTGSLAINIYSLLPTELRYFVEADYIIFYLASDESILVARMVHGRRNIPQVFRDEPLDDDYEDVI